MILLGFLAFPALFTAFPATLHNFIHIVLSAALPIIFTFHSLMATFLMVASPLVLGSYPDMNEALAYPIPVVLTINPSPVYLTLDAAPVNFTALVSAPPQTAQSINWSLLLVNVVLVSFGIGIMVAEVFIGIKSRLISGGVTQPYDFEHQFIARRTTCSLDRALKYWRDKNGLSEERNPTLLSLGLVITLLAALES